MEDKCKACMKNIINEKEKGICYQCNRKTMENRWERCSIIMNCSACGASVVGDGFWANCLVDNTEYTLIILQQILSKAQVLKLSKLLSERVLSVKEKLESQHTFTKKYCLGEILPIVRFLEEEAIQYSVDPELGYSEIWECEGSILM